MTHDLYVGTDADAVLSNPTLDTITTLFQSVVRNDFSARAAAMARKAASAGRPLLVGFKEASIINAPNLDFGSLADQGLGYDAAVPTFFHLLVRERENDIGPPADGVDAGARELSR